MTYNTRGKTLGSVLITACHNVLGFSWDIHPTGSELMKIRSLIEHSAGTMKEKKRRIEERK